MTEGKTEGDFWQAITETSDRLFTGVSDANERLYALSVGSLELARDRQREFTGLSRRWTQAPLDLPRLAVAATESILRLLINYLELNELWLRAIAGRPQETAGLLETSPGPSNQSGEAPTSTLAESTRESSVQPAEVNVQEAAKTEVAVEAYCLRCRAKRSMIEPREVMVRGGRIHTQGMCRNCGNPVSRIGPIGASARRP